MRNVVTGHPEMREALGCADHLGDVTITKKSLREAMSVTQYAVAVAYYERLLRPQVEADVPDGTPPMIADAGSPEVVPAPVSTAKPSTVDQATGVRTRASSRPVRRSGAKPSAGGFVPQRWSSC
jgi:hypothetical protein